MSSHTVAFYGSLLDPGLRRRLGVNEALRPLRRCLVRGRLFDLGPYPGLVEGDGRVRGELFEVVDPAIWKTLDDFEECGADPPLFVRRSTRLIAPVINSWVYFYTRPVGVRRRIRRGRWPVRALQ